MPPETWKEMQQQLDLSFTIDCDSSEILILVPFFVSATTLILSKWLNSQTTVLQLLDIVRVRRKNNKLKMHLKAAK